MMRRIHQALLLALLLIVVQTAILAHGHDEGASSGAAAQNCEFCASHHAAAPAPEAGGPTLPGQRSIRIKVRQFLAAGAADVRTAHRSRAPPAFRPV